jgi:phenylacetate-CoA ligase
MDWRNYFARGAFAFKRPEVLEYENDIRIVEDMNYPRLQRYQQRQLKQLLRHASQTVPYYSDMLSETGAIQDGEVNLSRFEDVPLLTKTELREQNTRLRSTEPGSNITKNTSGGTTGEPVEFLQDDNYLFSNNANRIYYHRLAGRELGEPWIKLWGDESDLFDERQSLNDRLADFVLNRHVLNSYRMGEDEMAEYVGRINEIQPKSMEVYVESMDELAKFIEENDLDVHSPNGILTTAGTLHQPVRERIERVFDAPVLNKYGSREVGTVACEAPQENGLRIFDHTHYVEVVDDEGNSLPPGEDGELAITVLTNYTMPLIRYRIGDMGIMKERPKGANHPFSMLETVTGRVTDHFRALDGDLVYPGHLRKVLYHRDWIKKFQIRQTEIDRVVYRIVVSKKQSPPQSELGEITSRTRDLLGKDITVEFEYPTKIETSDSGKYRCTISEVM